MTDWKKVLHSVSPRDEMRKIVRDVAADYGVSAGDIMGPSRLRDHAWPRQVSMWRIRRELDESFPKIGRFFNRDHTTVMHAVARVEQTIGETKCLQA